MEGAFFARGVERDGRGAGPAGEQSRAAGGGGGVRNCATEAGARELGAAQDPRAVFTPTWGGSQREHVQAGLGASRLNRETAAAAALEGGGGGGGGGGGR